jgi:hypothetical protein
VHARQQSIWNRRRRNLHTDDSTTIAVGVPHGRYTVAFHLESGQMSVLDTTGRDPARGPFLSSRQAWMVANELNTGNTGDTDRPTDGPDCGDER